MHTITSNSWKKEGHEEQETIKTWQPKNTKFFPMMTMTATLTQSTEKHHPNTSTITIYHWSRMSTIKIAAMNENILSFSRYFEKYFSFLLFNSYTSIISKIKRPKIDQQPRYL